MAKRAVNTIHDDVLGRVARPRRDDPWRAEFKLGPRHTVYLDSTVADGATVVTLLRLAVAWLPVGDPAARRFAATSESELFNDGWRDEADDPEPITRDEFARRLKLEGVEVHDDGSLSLWYDSSGMFTEHAFCVEVDADGEFTDAGMQ